LREGESILSSISLIFFPVIYSLVSTPQIIKIIKYRRSKHGWPLTTDAFGNLVGKIAGPQILVPEEPLRALVEGRIPTIA
jgi:hypothetical protein